MTFALVKNSQFIKLEKHDNFTWNNLQFTNVPLLSREERTAHGIYDFVPMSTGGSGIYIVDDSAGTVAEQFNLE